MEDWEGVANRHGLITGATGTGKTVSLQLLADRFSAIGVPVFLADVKGDLSGVAASGSLTPKLADRLKTIKATPPEWHANPAVFWDVLAHRGVPIRATMSDLGPLLLGRLLGLNPTQQGVLAIVFKIAVNGWVMGVAAGFTLLMGFLGGVIPAFTAMRMKVLDTLR